MACKNTMNVRMSNCTYRSTNTCQSIPKPFFTFIATCITSKLVHLCIHLELKCQCIYFFLNVDMIYTLLCFYLKIQVIQNIEITMVNAFVSKAVAHLETKEGCPLTPGTSFTKVFLLNPRSES